MYNIPQTTGGQYIVDKSSLTEKWYYEGELHRPDGPAITRFNIDGDVVSEQWYYKGQLHRVGGPALISTMGEEEWRFRGLLHRLDGPALKHSKAYWSDASKDDEWYILGVKYTEDEVKMIAKLLLKEDDDFVFGIM